MNPIDSQITVIIPCSVADYPYFLSWFKDYIVSVSSPVRHIIVINGSELPLPHILFQHEKLSYILVDKECSTPGLARNIAFNHVSHGFIAFLDAKTIPSENWLNHILKISHSNSSISQIGAVSYSSTRLWHYPLLCATYGFRSMSSLPGSIIHYSALHTNGYFLPRFRAGEDIDWLWRASQHNIFSQGNTPALTYILDRKLNLFNYLRQVAPKLFTFIMSTLCLSSTAILLYRFFFFIPDPPLLYLEWISRWLEYRFAPIYSLCDQAYGIYLIPDLFSATLYLSSSEKGSKSLSCFNMASPCIIPFLDI